jgi:hypothetical protein
MASLTPLGFPTGLKIPPTTLRLLKALVVKDISLSAGLDSVARMAFPLGLPGRLPDFAKVVYRYTYYIGGGTSPAAIIHAAGSRRLTAGWSAVAGCASAIHSISSGLNPVRICSTVLSLAHCHRPPSIEEIGVKAKGSPGDLECGRRAWTVVAGRGLDKGLRGMAGWIGEVDCTRQAVGDDGGDRDSGGTGGRDPYQRTSGPDAVTQAGLLAE